MSKKINKNEIDKLLFKFEYKTNTKFSRKSKGDLKNFLVYDEFKTNLLKHLRSKPGIKQESFEQWIKDWKESEKTKENRAKPNNKPKKVKTVDTQTNKEENPDLIEIEEEFLTKEDNLISFLNINENYEKDFVYSSLNLKKKIIEKIVNDESYNFTNDKHNYFCIIDKDSNHEKCFLNFNQIKDKKRLVLFKEVEDDQVKFIGEFNDKNLEEQKCITLW